MKYSFVVPIYNDAELARDFCVSFDAVFREMLNTEDIAADAELIFVNDGSSNDSIETLRRVCQEFAFARAIDLSRNFGHHIAVSCGYRHAKGEIVGMLNVDMQEPPSQIPKLTALIESSEFDIVFGLRRRRESPFLERLSSKLFGSLLNTLTGYEIPANISTLRVMNRKFVDTYNSLTERSRYLPGLEAWMGFKRGYTEIEHIAREKGQSSYTFKKRMLMALDSIISFSDLPLKFAVMLGICVASFGFLLNILLVIQRLFFIEFLPGYASTIATIVFLGGIQLIFIGLASLYIGRILNEVQNRPLYIVREEIK